VDATLSEEYLMLRKFLFTAALLASSAVAAAPASSFLHDAIQGDNSETRLGALIASRGSTASVRSFGRTLESDHSTAKVQAAAVARRMHVSVPNSMMPEARTEYAKLERMRGRAFDREVRRYMINDHEKDIAKFEAQVRNGDRQTAALARQQLPTLRKHLRMAESLRV
jgi:putative membrane protein